MSDDPVMYFLETTPRRVVSLVPSITESLFELGFGPVVVGVTDYCSRPEAVSRLPKVGGPKNASLDAIMGLQPDLVIANREENTRALVESLQAADATVWVTFPCTVREAVADLWTLTRLFRSDMARMKVDVLERSLEWTALANEDRPKRRVFCPIWQETAEGGTGWWMTFNAETYTSDLLAILGAENVFATRQRHYPLQADLGLVPAEAPGERDTRYPRVTRTEILSAQPDLILLPDEPYAYGDQDVMTARSWFAGTPAADHNQIMLVDGSLLMWPGTRLGQALAALDRLINLD